MIAFRRGEVDAAVAPSPGLPRYRAAREDDLAQVCGIYSYLATRGATAVCDAMRTPERMQALWDSQREKGLPFLVAELNGAVVGAVWAAPFVVHTTLSRVLEDTICIAPGHGGRGIGGNLLKRVVEKSAEWGASSVVAMIADARNSPALHLHRHCGFEQVGVLRNASEKKGRAVDALILQKMLT